MARNYREEERRRKERAIERGFSGRGQERSRKRSGKFDNLSPDAQKFLIKHQTKGIEPKGFELPEFGNHFSDAQRAQDWSDVFARSAVARYLPDERPKGMTKKAYTDAYMAAFVEGDDRYVDVRHDGGSDALEYWLVDVTDYMEADEYEARYGPQSEG